MRFLLSLFKCLPRFVTADYAVKRVGRSSIYEIVCVMGDVRPGERFDAIAQYSHLAIGNWGFFPRQVGSIRAFVNPHSTVVPQ